MPSLGLVVGKFAPPHRGHQLVIDTALGACERVVVLVYSNPHFPDMPGHARAAWIREAYKGNPSLLVFAPEDSPPNDADEFTHREAVHDPQLSRRASIPGWLIPHSRNRSAIPGWLIPHSRNRSACVPDRSGNIVHTEPSIEEKDRRILMPQVTAAKGHSSPRRSRQMERRNPDRPTRSARQPAPVIAPPTMVPRHA